MFSSKLGEFNLQGLENFKQEDAYSDLGVRTKTAIQDYLEIQAELAAMPVDSRNFAHRQELASRESKAWQELAQYSQQKFGADWITLPSFFFCSLNN